jgi:hypothetical protein
LESKPTYGYTDDKYKEDLVGKKPGYDARNIWDSAQVAGYTEANFLRKATGFVFGGGRYSVVQAIQWLLDNVWNILFGTTTFAGNKTFSSPVNVQGRVIATSFRAGQTVIADDAVTLLNISPSAGTLVLNSISAGGNRAFVQCGVAYRVTSGQTPFAVIAFQAADAVEATTGPLTGTTGTDGKFTVSADAATGTVYLENRTGASITVNRMVIG